jgi:serine protease Do
MQGNVIGINNAIFSTTGGSIGIGFAIPAETAEPIVQKLIAGEEILRGYLGVRIQPMNEDLSDALGLPANRGEFVQSVQPGEPAEQAGLQTGDVVLRVDGKDVTPEQTLSFIVANIEPGRRINLEIVRDGQRRTLPVTVGRRPSEEALAAQQFNPDQQDAIDQPRPSGEGVVEQSLGLQVIPITPQIAAQLGATGTQGVVVTAVDPNSDAAGKGLNRGTILLSVNGRPLTSVEQLEAAVSAAKAANREALLFRVRVRGAAELSVPIRLR